MANEKTDVARDDEVDLVVCSVRVDRHFQTVRPSLLAGKAVLVEWPLEKNVELAKEMSVMAKKSGSKTIVGLQAAFDPVLRLLKSTIESGRIGRVLGSTVFASEGNGGETEVKNVRYFLDREVGGNLVSIRWVHLVECIITGMSPSLFIPFLSVSSTPLLKSTSDVMNPMLTSRPVLGPIKSHTSLLSNRHLTKNIINPSKKQRDSPEKQTQHCTRSNHVPSHNEN